jgi:DNA-binding response OmpR family regulator
MSTDTTQKDLRPGETCPRPTALVVEDSEHVAYLLEYMLEREGFDVMVASNGRDAADCVAREPARDIVLLDVMLPYKDGFEIVREIRSSPIWQLTPVIMLSARSLEEDVVRALEAGANDYVMKPYNPRELLARVKRHIADRTPDRAATEPLQTPAI